MFLFKASHKNQGLFSEELTGLNTKETEKEVFSNNTYCGLYVALTFSLQ